MAEPAVTTSTATTASRVVVALAHLTVAYFDRQSLGDWARASVALRVFADTFNAHRAAVVQFVTTNSRDPGASALVPSSADAGFTAQTRRAMQVALLLYSGDSRMQGVVEAMPEAALPATMQAWFDGALRPVLDVAALALARSLAEEPVASAGTNLPSRVQARITGGVADVVAPGGSIPFDEAPREPADMPPIVITPTRWSMPTWGWWALASGVLVGVGVVGYGMVEHGWFRARRRKRRRRR